MALVDYASSDEDEKEDTLPSTTTDALQSSKRKRSDGSSDLPPIPSKFHDLYASTTRVSTRDDPSLHGGRKRVTPHIEGNWPTHLYIEWYPSTTEYESLTKLISILKDGISEPGPVIHSFMTSDLGAPLPLHISLSRTIGLSTDQKDVFAVALDRAVKSSGIRPFEVVFSGLDWVANFEKTRWFLVLRLQKADALNKLLHVSNTIVQEYGQPPLYVQSSAATRNEIPSRPRKMARNRGSHDNSLSKIDWSNMQDASDAFHISIAWMLTTPSRELLDVTKSTMENHFGDVSDTRLKIDDIKAKVGNIVTSMALPKNIESKGLFGF